MKEKYLDLSIIVLMILCGGLVIFEVSQWRADDSINMPQKSPVSQTQATDTFNLTMENEGSEIRGMIQLHESNKPTMYGSYLCSHCIDQKTLIDATKYNYVECTKNDGNQSKECIDNHIQAYPTWIFKNGIRHEGELNNSEFDKIMNDNIKVNITEAHP